MRMGGGALSHLASFVCVCLNVYLFPAVLGCRCCMGFSQLCKAGAALQLRASRCGGLPRYSWALEHRLSGCGSWA